jgi:hypothetical protein
MCSNLWESTIVPEIALVGEAVANESKLAFLHILLLQNILAGISNIKGNGASSQLD